LPETRTALVTALREHHHVQQVIYLHTEHLGPDALLVAAKAIFDPSLSAADVSRSIDEAEAAMRAAVPAARFIFIEPDIARS
jgi:divalent metal cation (Fe/Co/Zn/Cd) transporter